MEYRKFTVEEKTAFATQYAGGAILKELAATAGVSIPTMAKYIRAGGGALRKPGVQKQGNGDASKIVEQVNEILAKTAEQPVVVTTDNTAPVRKILSFE